MTKKDFFRILIKVFGLYSLIVTAFTIFPAQLSFVLSDIGWIGIFYILALLGFIVFIFIMLVKNPDLIINWLKLDSGFDEERIDFKYLGTESILKISAFIIGGILLINNIPAFLSHTYFGFKTDINRQGFDDRQSTAWATSFLNVIVGYLLVKNFDKISYWFNNKGENENRS